MANFIQCFGTGENVPFNINGEVIPLEVGSYEPTSEEIAETLIPINYDDDHAPIPQEPADFEEITIEEPARTFNEALLVNVLVESYMQAVARYGLSADRMSASFARGLDTLREHMAYEDYIRINTSFLHAVSVEMEFDSEP